MAKAWENKLKEELQSSIESVWDLKAWVSEHDEKATKKECYITFLENRYSEATSKAMLLKGQLTAIKLKLQGAESRAKEDKEKAMATEVMAWATKTKEVRAIKEYKKLIDFEDEVNEATCDALQKGFVECKKKVTEAFPKLKLDSIILAKPKSEEEEVEETKAIETKMISVNKTKTVKTRETKKAMVTRDA